MNIFTFIFSYLTIDFICTMVNKYVFKDENNEKDDEKDATE